jgi:hypothetical protein
MDKKHNPNSYPRVVYHPQPSTAPRIYPYYPPQTRNVSAPLSKPAPLNVVVAKAALVTPAVPSVNVPIKVEISKPVVVQPTVVEPPRPQQVAKPTTCCAHLWHDLHTRALTKAEDDKLFIQKWANNVPTYGCRCHDFWLQWVAKNPPVFGEEYFAWTVKAHNAVNAKLMRAEWTLDQARARWH